MPNATRKFVTHKLAYTSAAFALIFLIHIILPLCYAEDPYEGNKMYTVHLSTAAQAEELRTLAAKENLDIWTNTMPGLDVEILTTPKNQAALDTFCSTHGMTPNVSDMPKAADNSKKLPVGQMSWDAYYNEYETVTWLQSVASKYSESVKLESIGKTYEQRDLWLITIEKPGDSQTMGTFVDCLIHAREWIAGSMCTYMINELTANAAKYSELLSTVTFYFVPILNPDGFNYTHNDHRIWRKNRRPNKGAPPDDDCVGVDLNRNFPHHWNGPGASNDQCYNEYLGPSACSELECQHLKKFLESSKGKIDVYISIHTYSQCLLSPFSGGSEIPDDQADIKKLTDAMCKALRLKGTRYNCGRAWEQYQPLPGSSSDFAKIAGVKYAYLLELGSGGHQPDPSKIIPVAVDTWAAVQVAALKKNPDGSDVGVPRIGGSAGISQGKGIHVAVGVAVAVVRRSILKFQ